VYWFKLGTERVVPAPFLRGLPVIASDVIGSMVHGMSVPDSLAPELEDVIQHGSSARRAETLRCITGLFADRASQFNDDHVDLFDDVFCRLMGKVDTNARMELSHRLAPIGNAPREVVSRLAKDDDIAVARVILRQSRRIEESDLAEIAQTKSQAHLLALSKRRDLEEPVTDILVRLGDQEVLLSVAKNLDAQLSDASFRTLIDSSAEDDMLAQKLGLRPDIPPRLLRDLLLETSQAVHQRLVATAKPEMQSEIRRVLAEVSDKAQAKAAPRDYTAADRKILELHQTGRLDEATLVEFAGNGKYEEMIAALASLCAVRINVVDGVMAGNRLDPILILCKSVGWGRQTVSAIMSAMPASPEFSRDVDAAYVNFERLSPITAQRVMRFW